MSQIVLASIARDASLSDCDEQHERYQRSDLEMKNLSTLAVTIVIVSALTCLASSNVRSQALAGAERAKPVAGDPGISSMVVTDEGPFRVLRDYAEPGATRRMHSHDDASYHVFVLV